MKKEKISTIRISIGTAACINLIKMKLDAFPTTAYLMLHHDGKCIANCAFCSQARESGSKSDRLSRIQWPIFDFDTVLDHFNHLDIKNPTKRICIQVLNYRNFDKDLLYIAKKLRESSDLPISLSCHPLNEELLKEFHNLGVDRVGVPFDTATKELFYKIKGKGNKGPYTWEKHMKYLQDVKDIFGAKKTTVHLIVGLGESEYDAIKFIQYFKDRGIITGLFAFTPIKNTKLEKLKKPKYSQYRRVQLARYLIIHEKSSLEDMKFDNDKIIDFGLESNKLNSYILKGEPFYTSGCPNCNRPFYNERPGKKLYNYPRSLFKEEINQAIKDLGDYS
ncbi:MAG: radical SAM protein [Promethearchaeota archaeon]|nr:MAG: radical SAM protein [Candidatus Lokiarchaeota archaeon]